MASKKRLLILAMDIDTTAPGIVFGKLINELKKYFDVEVFTNKASSTFEDDSISLYPYKLLHPRIVNLLFSTIGFNPVDFYFSKLLSDKITKRYDLVFSFISYNHYVPLLAGKRLAKKMNAKHAVYCVDAIPPPIGWLAFDSYYKGLCKFIRKNLNSVDAFFSSNEKMLAHQMKFLNNQRAYTGIIYTPHQNKMITLKIKNEESNIFLYTGGIYGPRKVEYLISAFRKLLSTYPNSRLVFVGTKLPVSLFDGMDATDYEKIEIHPFTQDLDPFYERAIALIDIDGQVDDDVFLSSKIVNYLPIALPIISQTGEGSPSDKLFKDIPSILQCKHDEKELYEALIFVISHPELRNIDDRKYVIDIFDVENVAKKLKVDIENIFK